MFCKMKRVNQLETKRWNLNHSTSNHAFPRTGIRLRSITHVWVTSNMEKQTTDYILDVSSNLIYKSGKKVSQLSIKPQFEWFDIPTSIKITTET